MGNEINLLITLSDGKQLLRVAIKLTSEMLGDTMSYYLEPENKDKIKNLLPLHCQTAGGIVEVQEIFEIKDLTLK